VCNAKLKRFKKLYERQVPLFPEVKAELDKLRLGNEDTEFVINRSPHDWAGQFDQIAESAGIGKIPRPFDNMRASRATEVHNQYGAKKESLWIGHSEKIAMKFYLMVTDEDYAIATGKQTKE